VIAPISRKIDGAIGPLVPIAVVRRSARIPHTPRSGHRRRNQGLSGQQRQHCRGRDRRRSEYARGNARWLKA
jgi:hypothetical protein